MSTHGSDIEERELVRDYLKGRISLDYLRERLGDEWRECVEALRMQEHGWYDAAV